MSKNNIVIYSASTGGYDNDFLPLSIPGCDFIHFTDDRTVSSPSIQVRHLPASKEPEDARTLARRLKTQPHLFFPEYEYSMWIDSRIFIKRSDIKNLILSSLAKHNLALYEHMHSPDLATEVFRLVQRRKGNPLIIMKQHKIYQKLGYQEQPMVETGILVRRHNEPDIIDFNDRWAEHLGKLSNRDQVSFPFVAWQTGIKYKKLDGFIWENEYFVPLDRPIDVKFPKINYLSKWREYVTWTARYFADPIKKPVLSY